MWRGQRRSNPPRFGPYLSALLGMKDAIAFSALRPDEQQYILSAWNRADACHGLVRGIDVVTIHLHDNVTGLEAGVFGRATGPHALDRHALHVVRQTELSA